MVRSNRRYEILSTEKLNALVLVESNTYYFFNNNPYVEKDVIKTGEKIRKTPKFLVRRFSKRQIKQLVKLPDKKDVDLYIDLATSDKHYKALVNYSTEFSNSVEAMINVVPPKDLEVIMIIRGKRDKMGTWDTLEKEMDWVNGQKLFAQNIGAEVKIAENSGHSVVFDQSEIIVETVIGLINQ